MKKLFIFFIVLVIAATALYRVTDNYTFRHYLYSLNLKPSSVYSDKSDRLFLEHVLNQDLIGMNSMINNGYDVNASGKNGITPLYYAMLKKKKKSFDFLLDNGANPNIFVYEPFNLRRYTSLLGLALENEDIYYFDALVLSGADLYISYYRDYKVWVIDAAIIDDRLIAFKLLDEKGVDFEGYQSESGNNYDCVNEAAVSDHYNIVYFLLKRGVNHKGLDPYGHGLHFTMMREDFNWMSEDQEQYYQLCLDFLKKIDEEFRDIPDRPLANVSNQ